MGEANTRAAVFGAGGFLGAHLVRRLVADGWDVVAVIRHPPSAAAKRRVRLVAGDVEVLFGDARDQATAARAVTAADGVFPFFGGIGAVESLRLPREDLAMLDAYLSVLDAVREKSPDAVVVFPGSRLQYGRCDSLPVTESTPMRPTTPYGVHKVAAERYHTLYAELYGVRAVCLRIGNPYGALQYVPGKEYGLVGRFLHAASSGTPIRLYGAGAQLREFIHVDDLIELFVRAVTRCPQAATILNVPGVRPRSIREMAEVVVECVGRGRVIEMSWPPEVAAVETGDYTVDGSLARDRLGWAPAIDLEVGVRSVWREMQAYSRG